MIAWITEFGNVVYFFGQLIFWLVICVAAIWATLIFRRLVNGRIDRWAVKDTGSGTAIAAAPAAADKPSIDEFVD